MSTYINTDVTNITTVSLRGRQKIVISTRYTPYIPLSLPLLTADFLYALTLGIFHFVFITDIRNMVEIIPTRLTFPIIAGHNMSSTFGGKINEIASAELTVDEL